jgi:uncharacterized membrane protein
MALDHTRYFYLMESAIGNSTNLAITTPILFFTRFITHFCAPVFVFLAGTSAFLYGSNKSKTELFRFLFTRGLWLVFLEIFLNDFIWFFDAGFEFIQLQVIWVIGLSMICLSFMIFLPDKVILIVGIILVACHNLLDNINMEGNSLKSILWYILHQVSTFQLSDSRSVGISYPLIPWPGVMMLGYYLGSAYIKGFNYSERRKWLLRTGFGAIALFIVLRGINIYGDPSPWSHQKNLTFTILSFLKVTKYPASLSFLLITLGPSLLFLAGIEKIKNKLTDFLIVFGRVPLFYYFLHIFVLHLGATFIGGNIKGWLLNGEGFNSGRLAENGFSIGVVYIIWIGVVLLLYPICRWYMIYKSKNRDKWWLGYL